ncbi:MAG TPA: hypothetical protein VFE46_13345 [Pirellulales bacterium]|jgi:hypothetical protein|nr:hypothetical protein [Pirellulales bacterium]
MAMQNQAQPTKEAQKTKRPDDQGEMNKTGHEKQNSGQNQGQEYGQNQGQKPMRNPDEQNKNRDEGNQPRREEKTHSEQGKSCGS